MGYEQGEGAQRRFVEGVPANVTSIASARTISDAIRSGEYVKSGLS